jgi:hypothetical protein
MVVNRKQGIKKLNIFILAIFAGINIYFRLKYKYPAVLNYTTQRNRFVINVIPGCERNNNVLLLHNF